MRLQTSAGWCLMGWVAALLVSGCSLFGHNAPSQPAGTIVFGSGIHRVSAHQVIVRKTRSTFRDGQNVGWVAQLNHPVGKAPVTIAIINTRTKSMNFQGPVLKVNPKWIQLAASYPVDALVKAGSGGTVPGSYTVEYVQKGSVLAQGTIRITH